MSTGDISSRNPKPTQDATHEDLSAPPLEKVDQHVNRAMRDSIVAPDSDFTRPCIPDSESAWHAAVTASPDSKNRLAAIGWYRLHAAFGEAIRTLPLFRGGSEEGLIECLETCIFTGGVLGVLMHQIADEEAVSIEEGCAETAFIVWIGALADDVEGVGMLERFLVPIFTSLVEVGAQARRQLLPPIQNDLRSAHQSSPEDHALLALYQSCKIKRLIKATIWDLLPPAQAPVASPSKTNRSRPLVPLATTRKYDNGSRARYLDLEDLCVDYEDPSTPRPTLPKKSSTLATPAASRLSRPDAHKRNRTSSGDFSITLSPSFTLETTLGLSPSTPRRPLLTPRKHPRTSTSTSALIPMVALRLPLE